MESTKTILKKRFMVLRKHFTALGEYRDLIDELCSNQNIFDAVVFKELAARDRAIPEAYLKRFSSFQDYLGAKIFPLLVEVSGIGGSKMSEVLAAMEKEAVIDNFESWIELRDARNDLEHEYPETLQNALNDLKFCIDSFSLLSDYYKNAKDFANRYLDEAIE